MFNILVVDDQAKIREGIRSMLMGQREGLETETETASGGLEALEKIHRKRPQLVITDIRMPGMDGIALMEAVHDQYPEVRSLVVSGYDDFKYAQKAIEYGAKGYLLKPLERELLVQAVDRVIQEVELENKRRMAGSETKDVRKFLLSYLKGTGPWPDSPRYLAREYPFLEEGYVLLYLGYPGYRGEVPAGKILPQLLAGVDHILLQGPEEAVAVCSRSLVLSQARQCAEGQKTTVISVSGEYRGVGDLPRAYAQAREIYVHRFLFPDHRLLTQEEIENLRPDFTVPYRRVERIRDMLGACDEADIVAYISEIFDRKTLSSYRIGYTLALCDCVYRAVRAVEREIELKDMEETEEKEREKERRSPGSLMDFAGMREYLLALKEELLRLNCRVRQYREKYRENADMEKAIAYMKANYRRQLTLAMVSNSVSLNYAYFSNAFRKYTGMTFLEYLRDIRIAESKRLLAETDLRIGQVAEAVGYDSYKNFSRVFKEAVGVTPVDYRRGKQMRRGNAEE